jgi:hypothetical protein
LGAARIERGGDALVDRPSRWRWRWRRVIDDLARQPIGALGEFEGDGGDRDGGALPPPSRRSDGTQRSLDIPTLPV